MNNNFCTNATRKAVEGVIMESRMLRGIKSRCEMKQALLGLILLLVFPACKSYFKAADFDKRTANHKTVAVLPVEMVFTGVKPEKLTQEDVKKIEEAESKAFMISLYNEILKSTSNGKKPIRVDVQHYDKTLSILNANGINIRSSWSDDPGKLSKILGVDAVVKMRIEKHRLMPDLTSFGIDLGIRIIRILTDYNPLFWFPLNITKSKEVKSSCSLLDTEGLTLWSIAYQVDADWTRPANEIINNINWKSAKHFPYRIK